MFYNLSFNSVLLLILGLLLLAGGGYVGVNWRMYHFAIGLILVGIGSLLCVLTNGFSDYSPRGRLLRKIGSLAFLIGLPLVFYNLYRFI